MNENEFNKEVMLETMAKRGSLHHRNIKIVNEGKVIVFKDNNYESIDEEATRKINERQSEK